MDTELRQSVITQFRRSVCKTPVLILPIRLGTDVSPRTLELLLARQGWVVVHDHVDVGRELGVACRRAGQQDGTRRSSRHINLRAARTRLVAKQEDVAGAAFAVGYDSPSQFSREYRRMFGVPPSRDAAALREVAVLANSP